jgi:hypothetical protein
VTTVYSDKCSYKVLQKIIEPLEEPVQLKYAILVKRLSLIIGTENCAFKTACSLCLPKYGITFRNPLVK